MSATALVLGCGDGRSRPPEKNTQAASAAGPSSGPLSSAAPPPSASASALPSIELEDACRAYAQKVCEKQKDCAPAVVESSYGDVAKCAVVEAKSCSAHLAPPRSGTTPKGLSACAEARVASCESLLGDPPEACRMTGQGVSGSPCAEGAQCSGGFCERDPNRPCGTCRDLPKKQDPCIGSALCGWGLICKSGQCQTRGELGDSCSDIACNGTLRCSKGQCVAPAERGQRCDASDREAPSCNGRVGLICKSSTHVCVLPKYAKLGERCNAETPCAFGAHCGISSACERVPSEGDPCAPGGPHCVEPAQCLAGVCTTLDASKCR